VGLDCAAAGRLRANEDFLCDLVEPPKKYWFAHESARLLNPRSTFRDFSAQWLAWLTPKDKEIVHNPGGRSSVYAPLQEFLAGHGHGQE
jgi:hypothetical protein